MYGGIGLQTPRGSGTSGYVQKNRGYVPPSRVRREADLVSGKTANDPIRMAVLAKANQELLEHKVNISRNMVPIDSAICAGVLALLVQEVSQTSCDLRTPGRLSIPSRFAVTHLLDGHVRYDCQRKKEIESKVFDLRVRLEDEGANEAEIVRKEKELRARLSDASTSIITRGRGYVISFYPFSTWALWGGSEAASWLKIADHL